MVKRPGRGLSLLEAVLTLLLLVFLTLGFLRLFSKKTAVPSGPVPGGASLSIEAALSTLAQEIRNAGAGPLMNPIVPLAENVPGGYTIPLHDGRTVKVKPGTDVIAVRGLLRHPLLVLDPFDLVTRERLSVPARAQKPGRLQRESRGFRLRIPRFPLRLNPARNWTTHPLGLGLKWNASLAGQNAPLESTLAALSKSREGRYVTFMVSDAEGQSFAAKVKSFDASLLEKDCECRSPAPSPGDCPPGRRGCFLEVTLDFTAKEARLLDGHESDDAIQKASGLETGGIADEFVYFVASGEGGEPSYLAAARRAGAGYEVARVADEIEDLDVAYGLAEEETGAFDPLVSEVASPSVGAPGKGGDQWWPNAASEPLPTVSQLRDASGESRLRMIRLSVTARGAAAPAEVFVPLRRSAR